MFVNRLYYQPMVDRLLELGFVEAGSWALSGGKPYITLNENSSVSPALYAFVEDEDVVYVGKSIKTLRHRMRQYEKPGPTQRTSKRIHASIAASVAAGRRMRVFVLKCEKAIDYRGVKINIAAGLEDPLIALFKPAWNKTGKE